MAVKAGSVCPYVISSGMLGGCLQKFLPYLISTSVCERLPIPHLCHFRLLSGQVSVYLYRISTGMLDGCLQRFLPYLMRCLPLPHLYRRV